MKGSKEDEAVMLDNLRRWAHGEQLIRSVILTSTRATANTRVDLFSDYDVILAVTNMTPFFQSRTWLNEFGAVLVVYRDPIQQEFGYGRFRYITQSRSMKMGFAHKVLVSDPLAAFGGVSPLQGGD